VVESQIQKKEPERLFFSIWTAAFSTGHSKFAGWHAGYMLTHHLLGALATTAAVSTNAQLLADLCIAVALFDGLLDLLLRNRFA
jgi:hypothetical protein